MDQDEDPELARIREYHRVFEDFILEYHNTGQP